MRAKGCEKPQEKIILIAVTFFISEEAVMKKLIAWGVLSILAAGMMAMPASAQSTAPNKAQGSGSAKTKSAVPSANVTKEQIEAAQTLYENMTPEQKNLLAEEVKRQAAQITPEQKAALVKRAREHFASLTPQEQANMKNKLLELGARLSPKERAEYLKQLD